MVRSLSQKRKTTALSVRLTLSVVMLTRRGEIMSEAPVCGEPAFSVHVQQIAECALEWPLFVENQNQLTNNQST